MRRNKKEEIVKGAFEKAKQNSVSQAKSALAKLIAEEIFESGAYIAPKTVERAYDKYIVGDRNKGEPSAETMELLCRYLGFQNYRDFIKRQQPMDTPGIGVTKKKSNVWGFVLMVGLALLTLTVIWINYGSTIDDNSTQNCMVWKGTHYERTACETKVGLNVEPMDEFRLNNLKKIEVDMTTSFFDEKNNRALVWYHKNKAGEIEFYSAPGLHPTTGETLREITPYMIQKYVPVHIFNSSSFTE